MTDKELIKKEIERIEQILDDFNKTHNNTIDNGVVSAKKNICKHIKSFIDSLSEEDHFEDKSEMVSDDLEEAADAFYDNCNMSKSSWWDEGVLHKMSESKETFIAGAEWQKQKMMKDAVDVIFIQDYAYKTPVLYGDLKHKMNIVSGQSIKLYQIK